MSNVSPEIRAAQEAYAARPFAVMWRDSHAQVPSRFNTFDDAFEYVQEQWARIRKTVATRRHYASDLRRSYIETPEGRVSLRDVLLCDDVSSY